MYGEALWANEVKNTYSRWKSFCKTLFFNVSTEAELNISNE
ncbi:hypothetical protein M23134_03113 [Microscilla marina ATCC 23134]|uniref:Uncharacterized protein n=1 Tax=Microscilla marina ATCC 23134 TaxID=313606 RepID=A1ZG60_MICM2|nr:hypothetical protein M23134_03113 [Microscilla marina ATCC 23134]